MPGIDIMINSATTVDNTFEDNRFNMSTDETGKDDSGLFFIKVPTAQKKNLKKI